MSGAPLTPKVLGDDWDFELTIRLNGSIQDVSGATIKVAATDLHGVAVTNTVTLVEDAGWANGLVSAVIPAADQLASAADTSVGMLEVQITISGSPATQEPIHFTIRQGAIS